MIVARQKPVSVAPKKEKKQKPKLANFIDTRDFLGALTLLDVRDLFV